jgi:hypothetical protein
VLGHFATGSRSSLHRRRRTRRHGGQLVHVASLDPPLILFCRAHVVDVAAIEPPARSRSISSARSTRSFQPVRPKARPLRQTPWRIGVSGALVLEEAIAYLDCRFEAEDPAATTRSSWASSTRHARLAPSLFFKGGYELHDE